MIIDYVIAAAASVLRAFNRLPGWVGWAALFLMYVVIFLLIWGTVASW